MEDGELRQLFFEEAAELCREFEAGLLRLEQTPGDHEVVDAVFRPVHSLKGGAALMHLHDVVAVAHRLEALLDDMRRGRRAVTRPAIDTLLGSTDVVRATLTSQRTGVPLTAGERDAAAALEARLQRLMGESRPAVEYVVDFTPPADLLTRGLDPLSLIDDLADLGTITRVTAGHDRLPALADLEPERCYLAWTIDIVTDRSPTALAACFDFVADPDAVRVIEAQHVEAAETVAPAVQDTHEPSPPRAIHRRRAADRDDVIRVPVDKLDSLVNLVGEIVTTQSALSERAIAADDRPLAEAVGLMDRHVRALHGAVMRLRMVAVRTLFGRFPRLVRDLAAATGKDVVLEVDGEDTELDRTVIERLVDPLIHLVRNAIDHGLETPERRRELGKLAAGTVRLAAWQQGGHVYLEVSDDGGGLDPTRIQARAESQGLLAPGDTLDETAVLALIFRPGFSTAAAVTEVSGRGVGMDVVRKSVEALGGGIAIASTPGRGTRFRLTLPLTLAMLDGQIVRIGPTHYVLPLTSIVESLRATASMLRTVGGGHEVLALRDTTLPVMRLHRVLGAADGMSSLAGGLLVVVEHDGHRAALAIDDIGAQQQVVIKSLGTLLTRVEGVAGATVLGDGRVALILDVPGLLAPREPARQATIAARW